MDPIRAAIRNARREHRLGEGAKCTRCKITNPEALVRVGLSVLEEHHIAGKSNAPELTEVLCLVCHRIMHEKLAAAGVVLMPPATILDRAINVNQTLAVSYRDAAELHDELGALLATFRNALTDFAPGWHALPEARPSSPFNRPQPGPLVNAHSQTHSTTGPQHLPSNGGSAEQ